MVERTSDTEGGHLLPFPSFLRLSTCCRGRKAYKTLMAYFFGGVIPRTCESGSRALAVLEHSPTDQKV